VWTKSSTTDAGSSVILDISFQYALDPAKLGELYDLVTLDFDSLISTNSIDAIRNTAPLFGVDQYLMERNFIESVFAANVSVAIADLYASVIAMELRDVQLEAGQEKNLQPDFNVRVFESFDASSSALLRELDERKRSVQKLAESTSM
jgi:hypothetical protein